MNTARSLRWNLSLAATAFALVSGCGPNASEVGSATAGGTETGTETGGTTGTTAPSGTSSPTGGTASSQSGTSADSTGSPPGGTTDTGVGSSGPGGSSSGGGGDCAIEQVVCDGACVDTQTDPDHCGDCGNPCGAQVCVEGQCAANCGDLSMCGPLCVDFATDAQHCGDCDTVCELDELCSDGVCESFTPTGCLSCPCRECRDNCCEIAGMVVCAMGDCP